MRDLFVKAAAAIERGEAKAVANDRRIALEERMGEENARTFLARLPEPYVLAFDVDTMCMHESLLRDSPTVRCEPVDGGQVVITVVADDRPGLLVTLAGALTVCGLDVLEASLFGTTDGYALDVFRGADPFGRVADDGGARVADDRTRARGRARPRGQGRRTAPRLRPHHQAGRARRAHRGEPRRVPNRHRRRSARRRRHRVALPAGFRVHRAVQLDVRIAKVATLGKRVVDVFYVRDANARKIDDPDAVARLRATLVDRMTR